MRQVKAYKLIDGRRVIIATSQNVHATTLGGRFGVAKDLKILTIGKKKIRNQDNINVTLKKGRTVSVTGEEVAGNKPIHRHRGLQLESSDTSVVKVTQKGKLRAVGKGTCYVWVYAQNDVYRTITITVK